MTYLQIQHSSAVEFALKEELSNTLFDTTFVLPWLSVAGLVYLFFSVG